MSESTDTANGEKKEVKKQREEQMMSDGTETTAMTDEPHLRHKRLFDRAQASRAHGQ